MNLKPKFFRPDPDLHLIKVGSASVHVGGVMFWKYSLLSHCKNLQRKALTCAIFKNELAVC